MPNARLDRSPVRVAVIDDDDINRHGIAAVLSSDGRIEVAASYSHDEAMDGATQWDGIDVALIDAADHRRVTDQFPGVAVVEHIRRHWPADGPIVIVVTGHFFDDAVRRRMREARADFFYHRTEMADGEALLAAVLHPERARRTVPEPADPEAQFRHGVTDSSRVNRAVDFAVEQELPEMLAERAEPRSRRWMRLRHDFNRVARLTPITSDGRSPDRHQDLPSLPQISRFITWATRIKNPPSNDAHHHPRAPGIGTAAEGGDFRPDSSHAARL